MKDVIIHPKMDPAHRRTLLLPLLSLCLASGCGAEGDLPMENLGNTADLLASASQSPIGKARLSGRWLGQGHRPAVEIDGEFVDYTFPSGSRDVTLDLVFDENAFVSGNVVFGAGTPPPPRAGVSHPAGVDYGLAIVSDTPPVEGFAYALREAQVDLERAADEAAMLSYDQFGAFAEWCPLQPALVRSGGLYDCLGLDGYGGMLTEEGFVCVGQNSDGTTTELDCNMAALCSPGGPCTCDASGCAQEPRPVQVLLELTGNELTVSFLQTHVDVGLPLRPLEPLGPVRLERAAP